MSDQNPWPSMWCALEHGALPLAGVRIHQCHFASCRIIARLDFSQSASCCVSEALLGSECVYFGARLRNLRGIGFLGIKFARTGKNSYSLRFDLFMYRIPGVPD
jgi:hypothetical protein